MLRRFEFSHNGKRYHAHVVPFPPDGAPSYWYISVDNGPRQRLFESSVDDVPGETLERKILEAYTRRNE